MRFVSPVREIKVARRGAVLQIELDRPAERNALNYPMMMAIADLVGEATAAASDIRAILICGRGDDFCSGDTPKAMGDWPDRLRSRNSGGRHGVAPVVAQYMLAKVRAAPMPVVAVLSGAVQGAGLDLASVCDLRVADETARIGDPRILQARHGASGVTYVLPKLIGLSRAAWMLLTGEPVTAEQALNFGLVHHLWPAGELSDRAVAFAEAMAALPTRAIAVRKEMLLAQIDLPFEAAMVHCLGVRQTNVIEDTAEGMAAWRERRPPSFTGR